MNLPFKPSVPVDRRLQRLKFRCWHRGTREMDLVLGTFADRYVAELTTEQLDRFEALLLESDPDLYNWISGTDTPPPAKASDILDLLRAHRVPDAQSRISG